MIEAAVLSCVSLPSRSCAHDVLRENSPNTITLKLFCLVAVIAARCSVICHL